jgi:hypothetical protein
MAQATFTNVQTAKAFVKALARRGSLDGSGFWAADQWLRMAVGLAARMDPERAAIAAQMAGGKGVKFDGVFCQCCGTRLSAPESVAAGVGPKCKSAG